MVTGSNRTSPRALAAAGLELAALSGAAIAQPLLDEFGKAPYVFIRAGVSRWDIVLFALVIAVVPVAILLGVEVVVAGLMGERARRAVHLALVAGLGLLVALRAFRSWFGWQGALLLVVSLALTAGIAVVHSRSRVMREWLRWAAALPVIAVVLFLVFSPVADLVRGGAEPASAAVTVKTQRSVVVLLLDEFPVLSLLDANGRIDARRLPNFARLARESTWFRNTTTVGTHTQFAIPAIMTGQYPKAGASGAPTYAEYPDSIFRLLGAAYPANVSELVTRLCAPSYCRAPRTASGRRTPSASSREGLGGLLSRRSRPVRADGRAARLAQAGRGRRGRAGRRRHDDDRADDTGVDRPGRGRDGPAGKRGPPRSASCCRPRNRRASPIGSPASPRTDRRRCTSRTCCCRTSRGCTRRAVARTPSPTTTSPGSTRACGSPPKVPTSPAAGISCRWATSTGWSARSSRA